MSNTEKKKSRNEQIAEMLSVGEKLKDFYRFTAQNPHIDLHDSTRSTASRKLHQAQSEAKDRSEERGHD